MATSRICSVAGCSKPHKARGFCMGHYDQAKLHGDPLKRQRSKRGEAANFIQTKVLPYQSDECLVWPYTTTPNGYAVVWIEGALKLVSRIVCAEVNGPPNEGDEAAHSCGRGHEGCVTPGHLTWKTSKQNSADAIGHGTWNHGEKVPSAKLNRDQVRDIRRMEGRVSTSNLAAQYGVSGYTIREIQRGKTWTWLD